MTWDADQRLLYEERVAIMVHDGGLEPAEAERRARKIVDGRADEPEQMNLMEPEYKQLLREWHRAHR